MHALLSCGMVAAALAGFAVVLGRRVVGGIRDPASVAQSGGMTAAMVLHAIGAGGSSLALVGAGLLVVMSVAGAALRRRAGVGAPAERTPPGGALSRAVMGIAMAFLLLTASVGGGAGVGSETMQHVHPAASADACALVVGGLGIGVAAVLAARSWRARRYGAGVECISIGVCLGTMGAMVVL